MLKWTLGIVAGLVVVGIAASAIETKPETEPEDRKYSSIEDLKAAVIKAGYECPSWGKVEESSDLSGSIKIVVCSNDDTISQYGGAYARRAEKVMQAPCSDVGLLNGPNWRFESARAAEFHDDLGGKLCAPQSTPK